MNIQSTNRHESLHIQGPSPTGTKKEKRTALLPSKLHLQYREEENETIEMSCRPKSFHSLVVEFLVSTRKKGNSILDDKKGCLFHIPDINKPEPQKILKNSPQLGHFCMVKIYFETV